MVNRISVTIADDQLTDIHAVAGRLAAAGMHIDRVLPPVGVITGYVETSQRNAVERVPGVAAVEDETTFQLPPSDDEVQ
jgi:hypothetical protein